jgi:DNA-binding NarL/FixJ family response regulator
MPATGLLLADDFLWISRITASAMAHGIEIRTASNVERLAALAQAGMPQLVIIDLGLGVPAGEVVSRLRSLCTSPIQFVAYGSHVDVGTLRAAREAGCDPVLPRSKMAEDLERLLCEWTGQVTSPRPGQP